MEGPNKDLQLELLMEKIRSKSNQLKSFGENAKALRLALLDKRYPLDVTDKLQLQKCLDTLQHSIKVTSLQAIVERLESISRQLGLKFQTGPTGNDYFISSDMFYLEISIEVTGLVRDVKIQHEGKPERQSSLELVQCLQDGDFADFTSHLEGLASIYQLNADKKVKSKAFVSLQALENDLVMLAQVQSFINEPYNVVHKSPVGVLQPRKGGHPMKLTYFISPYDLLDAESKTSVELTVDNVVNKNLGCSVQVCIEGSTSHKLQICSLMTVNRSADGKGSPSFSSLTNVNSATLPAYYTLRLPQAIPLCVPLVNKLNQATGIECGDLTTPLPLLSLIVQHTSAGQLDCSNNRGLFVTLPDQQHCYFMTENMSLQGVMVSSIPFTHPAHVPQILTTLRQQVLFNVLVASCIRPASKPDLEKAIMFEITTLSWQHMSISFEHPLEESMATAEFNLSDIANVKCKLFTSANDILPGMEDYANKVAQRCLSIPVTMRALIRRWQIQAANTNIPNPDLTISIGRLPSTPSDPNQNNKFLPELDQKFLTKMEPPTAPCTPPVGTVVSDSHTGFSLGSTTPDPLRSTPTPPTPNPTTTSELLSSLQTALGGSSSPMSLTPPPFGVTLTLKHSSGPITTPPPLAPPSQIFNPFEQSVSQKSQKLPPQLALQRKRKAPTDMSRSGRSPKRLMSEDCELELGGGSSESTPLGTPVSNATFDLLQENAGILVSKSEPIDDKWSFEMAPGTLSSGGHTPASEPSFPIKSDPFELGEGDGESSHGDPIESDAFSFGRLDLLSKSSHSSTMEQLKRKSKKLKMEGRSKSVDLSMTGEERSFPIDSTSDVTKTPIVPSVSITPVTTGSTTSMNSMLTNIGFEGRRGIEIIPIVTTAVTSLPSSITITPITSSKEKKESDKVKKEGKKMSDEERRKRERKRKHDEGIGGSSSKSSKLLSMTSPGMQLNLPAQTSMKPVDKSTMNKEGISAITVSLTTSTSPSITSSKVKCSTPPQSCTTSSPSKALSLIKSSSPSPTPTGKSSKSSPSPKHPSSGGKPSMSTLKSASVSLSGMKSSGGSSKLSGDPNKFPRPKDRNRTSSPNTTGKLKPPLKLKALDMSQPSDILNSKMYLGGQPGPPPPGSGGGSPTTLFTAAPQSLSKSSLMSLSKQDVLLRNLRNKKNSINDVIEGLLGKLGQKSEHKSDPSLMLPSSTPKMSGDLMGKTSSATKPASSEYMVKSSPEGIKLTINKTKSKDGLTKISSSMKSSTGLKPGVMSGPASRKTMHKGPSKSPLSMSGNSGGSGMRLTTSPSKAMLSANPKLCKPVSGLSKHGLIDMKRDKFKSDKFKSSLGIKMDSRMKGSLLRPGEKGGKSELDNPDLAFRMLLGKPLDGGLSFDGPKLDPKFQIPKLSRGDPSKSSSDPDKNNMKGDNSSKGESSKLSDTSGDTSSTSKIEDKLVKPKPAALLPTPTMIPDIPPTLSAPIVTSSSDMSMKSSTSSSSVTKDKMDDVPTDLSMKPQPKKEIDDTVDPSSTPLLLPPPPPPARSTPPVIMQEVTKPIWSQPKPKASPPTSPEDLVIDFQDKSKGAIPSSLNRPHRNTPPIPMFPPSPTVSLHIVKSPAPVPSPLKSPLTVLSPHSSQASPCVIDDDLMDEALIGMGK